MSQQIKKKTHVKEAAAPTEFKLIRLEHQVPTRDSTSELEERGVRIVKLVIGIGSEGEERLLGTVLRKESSSWTGSDSGSTWHYLLLGGREPVRNSRRGLEDLWRQIHRHHGLPFRTGGDQRHPPSDWAGPETPGILWSNSCRITGDWSVGVHTIPGSGVIKVQLAPGLHAYFDPAPDHWRSGGAVVKQLGRGQRQVLESALKDFNRRRLAAFQGRGTGVKVVNHTSGATS